MSVAETLILSLESDEGAVAVTYARVTKLTPVYVRDIYEVKAPFRWLPSSLERKYGVAVIST